MTTQEREASQEAQQGRRQGSGIWRRYDYIHIRDGSPPVSPGHSEARRLRSHATTVHPQRYSYVYCGLFASGVASIERDLHLARQGQNSMTPFANGGCSHFPQNTLLRFVFGVVRIWHRTSLLPDKTENGVRHTHHSPIGISHGT